MNDNENDDPGLVFDDTADDGIVFDPRIVGYARAVREECARARWRAPAENDPLEVAREERDTRSPRGVG